MHPKITPRQIAFQLVTATDSEEQLIQIVDALWRERKLVILSGVAALVIGLFGGLIIGRFFI